MKEGLIALNYECSKCNERMGLYERKSAVLDGDFEWVCSTIASQNIYGRTPMIILLTMRPSRLFVKIRCHAVASTRKRSAQDNARPRVAKTVQDFCSTQFMQLLLCLAYSPDMSPTGHVSYLVDRRLARVIHVLKLQKVNFCCAYKQYGILFHKQTFKICLTPCV
ncbi:uncharacterized protein TNCV_2020851 [Trichonephila clavipes]|nr:uncharacterized protein TNCV_2020851 [Trichonephila clavipes]